MAVTRFTDLEIKNIGSKPLRESLGRGNGSVLFKKPQKNIEAYYIYKYNNTDHLIKIGNFKHGTLAGLTSKQIRAKSVADLSQLTKKHQCSCSLHIFCNSLLHSSRSTSTKVCKWNWKRA